MSVVIALTAAWWSLTVMHNEVRRPSERVTTLLLQLIQAEERVDLARGMLDPGASFRASTDPATVTTEPAELDRQLGRIETDIGSILSLDGVRSYAGTSTTVNLAGKLDSLRQAATPFLKATDQARREATRSTVSTELFKIHELLKKMERSAVQDLRSLVHSSDVIRSRLAIVLSLSLLVAVLTAFLALTLMRRWVVNPVARLRAATARIASGDFDHRIALPLAGRGDELVQLSGEVNHMAGMVNRMQTERIEQERLAAVGELVRRLAHNLRNPLSGIRSLAELSRTEAASLGPQATDLSEAQNRIIAAVDRFERWLSDLLNVTKPTQLHREPVSTRPWLAGLCEAHRPQALGKKLAFEIDQAQAPDEAVFDPRHLEHALSAIVSNALEATAARHSAAGLPGTQSVGVHITSSVVNANNPALAAWEIRVEDDGPGIPGHLRESIFKPYFTTKRDGNGIGLAVAQQVVRAHGGQITVSEAARPPGAAFVIRLPLVQSSKPTQGSEKGNRASDGSVSQLANTGH